MLGDLEVPVPIVQGAMGVKVSSASLASAVANCGGAGTIASVGLGYGTPENEVDFVAASNKGLQEEMRQARAQTDGVVGVNIMVALSNYKELVRVAVAEGADFIVSGAGLPLKLPALVEGSSVKLVPIVSSARAADVIIKGWKKKYDRLPDAIVVEGPLAGGHLGFSFEELTSACEQVLEKLVADIVTLVNEYKERFGKRIPVIAAGGIFDGKDMVRFLRLGAQGVQMATRFVATFECSVSEAFKQMYVAANKEDIAIIKSPVGMPGRALKTALIDKVLQGIREQVQCGYVCLKACDPLKAPYCIAKALFNAFSGNIDNALVFAGSNVFRVKEIVSVQALIDAIVHGALQELASPASA